MYGYPGNTHVFCGVMRMSVLEILTETGKAAGSISTIVGAIALILWKPLIKPMIEKRRKAQKERAESEMKFREETISALERVHNSIVAIEANIDSNEKDRIRWEVLDFANSCRNGRRHTQDEFEHIIVLNRKYNALLEKTGDENGVFTLEYQYIEGLYKKCQIDNDFL